MERLSLIIFLVSFITNSAFANTTFGEGVSGNWTERSLWDNGVPTEALGEIRIRNDDSVCLLNTVEGANYNSAQKLRIYNEGELVIADGGELLGTCWLRVGTIEGPGIINQSGGLIRIRKGTNSAGKLQIGDGRGSEGSVYTMTGGTLTYLDGEASLWIGYRGGSGIFKVAGTSPVISMKELYVAGGSGDKAGTGTLAYEISSDGVSKIMLSNYVNINIDDTGKAYLDLSLIPGEVAPSTDIVLVENTGQNSIKGSGFSEVYHNGGTANGEEGCQVQLGNTCYTLTYKYDATGDSNNNDIALVYVPEPALLILLGIGGLTAAGQKK
jgi:hypothetical protein